MTEERPLSRTLLVIVASLLTFAGPTYVVYALSNMVDLNYFVAIGTGFALFLVGLILLLILIKRKIIA